METIQQWTGDCELSKYVRSYLNCPKSQNLLKTQLQQPGLLMFQNRLTRVIASTNDIFQECILRGNQASLGTGHDREISRLSLRCHITPKVYVQCNSRQCGGEYVQVTGGLCTAT